MITVCDGGPARITAWRALAPTSWAVEPGARTHLPERRQDEFARQYVAPLVTEARQPGIDTWEEGAWGTGP